MNLSNIETFVAVVKFMNFSKAADSLFVSQSTVTSRIKSLEDELNIQLFAREGKSISLTAVGERFFEHAVKIQELLAATEQDIAMYNKYSSCLSICAPDSVWEYTLADYASRFMASHPETAMKLKCGHSEFVISDLLLGLADIGVVFQRVHDDEIESREFFRSKFNLVAKKGLVPEGTLITPQNIQEFHPMMIEWGRDFNLWYNKYYKTQIHCYEIDGVFLFVNMLLNGRGIGFLPDRISNSYINSGQLTSLQFAHQDSIPTDIAYIIFLRKNWAKVQSFVEMLCL